MKFLTSFWNAIVEFFSPTTEEWKTFRKKSKKDGDTLGYGGDVYSSDSDCGGGED